VVYRDFVEMTEKCSPIADDWKKVLFPDETRVSLKSPDGREHVWRGAGERFASCNVSSRVQLGDGSVMFWGRRRRAHTLLTSYLLH
jgi:hypothetical protein